MDFDTIKKKLKSRILWMNCLGIVLLFIVLLVVTIISLNAYTHHGEAISVPDVTGKPSEQAQRILASAGLTVAVADTGYVRAIARYYVLEQNPSAGEKVKASHVVQLTVNASRTPTLAMPDIIQNCSLREAQAKLRAMGFKVGEVERVTGEKDWVYGVTVGGRHVLAGERVAVDKTVIIQAGMGYGDDYYDEDSLDIDVNTEAIYSIDDDDFEDL